MQPTPALPTLLAPVNEALAPALRLGLLNPLPFTAGIVLLEVTGRVSGRVRQVPLVCVDHGSALTVSTVRSNSQWVKNLAARPDTHVWLRGERRPVAAEVFVSGNRVSAAPGIADAISRLAAGTSRAWGVSQAILRPR